MTNSHFTANYSIADIFGWITSGFHFFEKNCIGFLNPDARDGSEKLEVHRFQFIFNSHFSVSIKRKHVLAKLLSSFKPDGKQPFYRLSFFFVRYFPSRQHCSILILEWKERERGNLHWSSLCRSIGLHCKKSHFIDDENNDEGKRMRNFINDWWSFEIHKYQSKTNKFFMESAKPTRVHFSISDEKKKQDNGSTQRWISSMLHPGRRSTFTCMWMKMMNKIRWKPTQFTMYR